MTRISTCEARAAGLSATTERREKRRAERGSRPVLFERQGRLIAVFPDRPSVVVALRPYPPAA